MSKKTADTKRIIAQNRRARHDYAIEEVLEAGLVLTGSEVKSLRAGKANISDAYAAESQGELVLFNAHISEYKGANRFNHAPLRPRKLLLHRKQINKWLGKVKLKGYTLVALSLYFNARNIAKCELGLAKGKKEYDRRADIKARDWEREKQRAFRDKQ